MTEKIIGAELARVIGKASAFIQKCKESGTENEHIKTQEDGKKYVETSTGFGITLKVKEYSLMEERPNPLPSNKKPDPLLWSECEIALAPAKLYNWFKDLGSPVGRLEIQSLGLQLSFYPNSYEGSGILALTSTQSKESVANSVLIQAVGKTPIEALESNSLNIKLTAPEGDKRKFVERIMLMRIIRASDGRVIRVK